MKKCATEDREVLIAGLYEALVDWVIVKANEAIRSEMHNSKILGSSSGSDTDGAALNTPPSSNEDQGDSVSLTVVEIPSQQLGKAVALKTVFDDSTGINQEMKEDGVPFVPAGSSVIREMKDAVNTSAPDMDVRDSPATREREQDLDRRQGVLEKVGAETEEESFLRSLLYPLDGQGIVLGKSGRFNLANLLGSSRVWFHLCLHPSDDAPATFANPSSNSWSAGSVSSQIRGWRLPEWANHRNKQLDFTADFDVEEFVDRYSRLGCQPGREGVEAWLAERGWSNGEVVVGSERIWMRESSWWEAESMLDMKPQDTMPPGMLGGMVGAAGLDSGYSVHNPGSGFFGPQFYDNASTSRDNLLGGGGQDRAVSGMAPSRLGARSVAPTALSGGHRNVSGGDYGLGTKGDDKIHDITYDSEIDPELMEGKELQVEKQTFGRRAWVAATWCGTFWIPSFFLKHLGRMKRPDVRLAWREKFFLVILILILNALVVFYIVAFGNLLCPNMNKAWNSKQVGYHQGETDYYVSFRGGVYDLTDFWKLQHSDTAIETSKTLMEPFGGTDVTEYIVPPLTLACPGLVDDDTLYLQTNDTLLYPQAEHTSGPTRQPDTTTKLHNANWYTEDFLPRMKEYYKGDLVYKRSKVKKDGEDNSHMWFIIDEKIYDLTNYFYTLDMMNDLDMYSFFSEDVEDLVQRNPGQDITKQWEEKLNYTTRMNSLNCLNNMFYIGRTDFRDSARCQVNNYILLAFTIVLCATILVKF
ncbi:chitin synthase, partial [Hortaea werneckii]